MNKQDVIETIFRGITFVLGTFLLGLTFNLFFKRYDLIVGSMSGIGLILEETTGFSSTLFIWISSIALLIISYILLGKESTSNAAIGSILYPLMVTTTAPIAEVIEKYVTIDEHILIVILAAIAYGISNGMIYKVGFSTGGGDILMQLISKYMNIPTASANAFYSAIIVFISGFVFGWTSFVYAVIILIISNIVINKLLVGISNSKVFFIRTNKAKEIKNVINSEFESGFTILNTESSFLKRHGELIMVAVSTRKYYQLKNRILDIDPDAFFVINDCYEVNGGMRKSNIPFL